MVGLVATVAFWTQFLANRARDAQFSLLVNTQTAMVKLEGTHRRAEEIHRMQEELARFKRIASIEAVATSIAHEINQPVGSAQTFAEAAARWLALDPPNLAEVRNAIGQIVCQTTRAGEIITTIRRMSSRGSIQYQVVNLASVIDDAANVLSAEIDDARVEFNIMRQTDNVIVMGSVDELMNVFVNIIRNAIESFRALDGRRVITVGISSADKGWVDCEIKDNGAGIAAKDLDHIFETYFTTKERGMGIGLAVCRYLVERHGGSLIMRSSPGQGTVAIVRFPQQVEAG